MSVRFCEVSHAPVPGKDTPVAVVVPLTAMGHLAVGCSARKPG